MCASESKKEFECFYVSAVEKRNSIFLVNSLIDFGCWIVYASSLSLNNNGEDGDDDNDEWLCVPRMYATTSI